MVVSLEQGADLHMAQLMPLPLTVSCFSKIQIGFTFLVPAHQVVPDKGPLNGCVCVVLFRYKIKPKIPFYFSIKSRIFSRPIEMVDYTISTICYK